MVDCTVRTVNKDWSYASALEIEFLHRISNAPVSLENHQFARLLPSEALQAFFNYSRVSTYMDEPAEDGWIKEMVYES